MRDAIGSMVKERKDLIKEFKKNKREIQRKMEEGKIRVAKWSKSYKDMEVVGRRTKYLENIGTIGEKDKGISALIRLRCRNIKENEC